MMLSSLSPVSLPSYPKTGLPITTNNSSRSSATLCTNQQHTTSTNRNGGSFSVNLTNLTEQHLTGFFHQLGIITVEKTVLTPAANTLVKTLKQAAQQTEQPFKHYLQAQGLTSHSALAEKLLQHTEQIAEQTKTEHAPTTVEQLGIILPYQQYLTATVSSLGSLVNKEEAPQLLNELHQQVKQRNPLSEILPAEQTKYIGNYLFTQALDKSLQQTVYTQTYLGLKHSELPHMEHHSIGVVQTKPVACGSNEVTVQAQLNSDELTQKLIAETAQQSHGKWLFRSVTPEQVATTWQKSIDEIVKTELSRYFTNIRENS